MNIKILDSWLREFVKTRATVSEIAEKLSLTSVSVERIEAFKKDSIYDIEVTTNRPDLMSVVGIARETAAILPQFGINATFIPPAFKTPQIPKDQNFTIHIENDPKLVRRICAVILEVKQEKSPQMIQDRLESTDIRSLGNLVDITNYVMREIGHPTHVFDYDRLTTKKLIIRESKKGEKLTTLDGKIYELPGGDIIADDGTGKIVDLLGVMGTENSVVTKDTKRILFFIDNNDPMHIRKTSMKLGIRTEAAIINEKGVDTQLSYHALLLGISLFQTYADARLISNIIDIYPVKQKSETVSASFQKINTVLGVNIPDNEVVQILKKLEFSPEIQNQSVLVHVPPFRQNDIRIPEDLIEEIARIYGYQKLPTILPPLGAVQDYQMADQFFWEKRVKNALKYWGFTEVYTYSMVSEELYEGNLEDAVTIQNPLNSDLVYMRKTLVPSLLQTTNENKSRDQIKIFEISNVYLKNGDGLPREVRTFAGVVKQNNVTFFEVKGYLEQILKDVGINNVIFSERAMGGVGADIAIGKEIIGNIEVLDNNLIDFEINFDKVISLSNLKKIYYPVPKYPPVIEDITVQVDQKISYGKIVSTIQKQSPLITTISMVGTYQNKKTFRICYQDIEKNLKNEEIQPIREKIYKVLREELHAKIDN